MCTQVFLLVLDMILKWLPVEMASLEKHKFDLVKARESFQACFYNEKDIDVRSFILAYNELLRYLFTSWFHDFLYYRSNLEIGTSDIFCLHHLYPLFFYQNLFNFV